MTSASVDDSQVAIPLMKTASAKVDYLYDLMDADYDSNEGYNVSRTLGYVPIIEKTPVGIDRLHPWLPMKRLVTKKEQLWSGSTVCPRRSSVQAMSWSVMRRR